MQLLLEVVILVYVLHHALLLPEQGQVTALYCTVLYCALRGELRHFGLVVGLELGHLAPQHRDVGLGLAQQRLQLDVLLEMSNSCLFVVTISTQIIDLVGILQLLPGVVVLLLVLAHPLVHLLEQPTQSVKKLLLETKSKTNPNLRCV